MTPLNSALIERERNRQRSVEQENKEGKDRLKRKGNREQEREITIRFQENANRKVVDYKINEFQKFLSLIWARS